MNEIEMLEELRAGLPDVRDEVRAAARARLLVRVEHAQRSARPAAWPLRRRAKWSLAVAGVGVAALLAALPILGGGGGAQPALGQVLRQAAAVATDQEPVLPGPSQYLFTRSRGAYLQETGYSPRCRTNPCDGKHPWEATAEWSVLVPSVREGWTSLDGTRRGRVREVLGRPRFVSPGQRAGWVAAGSPSLPRAGRVEDSTTSGSNIVDASKLPTEPAALRRLIEARAIPGVGGPPGEVETFTLIGDMLREAYLPAAIRAALYRLTAELPGVRLLGEVRDPVGRPGTGIAFTDRKHGIRYELIFDPGTSELLGERQSIVRSGAFGFAAPPGTVIGYSANLESKVVDSVGSHAPAGAGKVDDSVGCYDRASPQADTTVVHGADPIATCAKLWRAGGVDTRRGPASPHLVACAHEGSTVAHVFPGSGPALCRRLGLVPLPAR